MTDNLLVRLAKLGRDVLPSGEQPFAEAVLELLGEVFPKCAIAIRVLDRKPPILQAIAATAEIHERHRDLSKVGIHLTPAQLNGVTLDDEQLRLGYVQIGRDELPLLEGALHRIVLPIIRDGVVIFVLNVECQEATANAEEGAEILSAVAEIATSMIVERRRNQENQEQQRRLSAVLEQSSALIMVLDSQHRIRLFNRMLANVVERDAETLSGKDVLDYIAIEDRAELLERFEQCLSGSVQSGLSLRLIKQGGGSAETIFSIEARFFPDGSLDSILGIGQDLSDLRSLQQQVLQVEKLSHLGRLAAGIVHELNTPLTSISVYGEYLLQRWRDKNADLDDVRRLQRIVEGAQRISALTRNLLEYARRPVDKVDVVELNQTVVRSISFCEHLIEEANISLETDLTPHLQPLFGVAEQLQQMVINLLTNACDATGPGGRVWVRTKAKSSGEICLEIQDTGSGILTEDLPHIFDPFFTKKEAGAGTGLGLSIVKNVVDFHRGNIIVDSEEGRGTVVSVILPVLAATIAEEAK